MPVPSRRDMKGHTVEDGSKSSNGSDACSLASYLLVSYTCGPCHVVLHKVIAHLRMPSVAGTARRCGSR